MLRHINIKWKWQTFEIKSGGSHFYNHTSKNSGALRKKLDLYLKDK